jgi:hypothetical protein
MENSNHQKFNELRKFNLPTDQYAITGSGPLGIRNLREIGDIDIIVTDILWSHLAEDYGITEEDGIQRIVLVKNLIEAFGNASYVSQIKFTDAPSVSERIDMAEMIEGLPFECPEHVIFFKRKMGREKDLNDIRLLELN